MRKGWKVYILHTLKYLYRDVLSSASFEKTDSLREMFHFNFVRESGKSKCTIESDGSKVSVLKLLYKLRLPV